MQAGRGGGWFDYARPGGEDAARADVRTTDQADLRTTDQADLRSTGQVDPRSAGQVDPRGLGQVDPRSTGRVDARRLGRAEPMAGSRAEPVAGGRAEPVAGSQTEPMNGRGAAPTGRGVGRVDARGVGRVAARPDAPGPGRPDASGRADAPSRADAPGRTDAPGPGRQDPNGKAPSAGGRAKVPTAEAPAGTGLEERAGSPAPARRSKRKIQIWMTVNAVVLALIAAWVLWPSSGNSTGADTDLNQGNKQIGGSAAAITPPTKDDILAEKLPRFGLATPNSPWSKSEINTLAAAAGTHPTMLQYFVKWTEDFRADEVAAAYDQKALPMLSWEPWAGASAGECQSAYTLPKIINGSFDAYINKFAAGVAADKFPIALRFAHEMNGHWYPWSESCPGNHLGDYVKAWQHVHDLFTAAGATNVIWVWSPNILRPVPNTSIKALYPGDKYVDWIGMVGYAVYESTAAAVFQPTMTAIRQFTKLPLVITETGVQSGPLKTTWIQDFFKWLPQHPDVRGFVWFEYSVAQGGSADWRFTETAASKAAFHDAITKCQLAGPPTARTVVATPTPTASASP
jgi:hypothetical protein